VTAITSRANPQFQALRQLATRPSAWREQGRVWLEGEHLVSAALARGVMLEQLVLADTLDAATRATFGAQRELRLAAPLFEALSSLPSPAHVGAVVALPPASAIDPLAPTVVLDRVQDAGNVGSILRSAAALGWPQVIALKGTAALWSPKVLRAGMGAHFGLRLIDAAESDVLDALQVPLLATTPHGGLTLGHDALPHPCAWVLGHEGQGVAPELMARCAHQVRIPQPGGEESLNVAAAAAICLFLGGGGDVGGV